MIGALNLREFGSRENESEKVSWQKLPCFVNFFNFHSRLKYPLGDALNRVYIKFDIYQILVYI